MLLPPLAGTPSSLRSHYLSLSVVMNGEETFLTVPWGLLFRCFTTYGIGTDTHFSSLTGEAVN